MLEQGDRHVRDQVGRRLVAGDEEEHAKEQHLLVVERLTAAHEEADEVVAGPLAALVASSVAFGVVHRRLRLLHVATGAAFGGVYLLTGALAASLAAHWVYNTLVASHVAGEPP
jgi:hypothetical protein